MITSPLTLTQNNYNILIDILSHTLVCSLINIVCTMHGITARYQHNIYKLIKIKFAHQSNQFTNVGPVDRKLLSVHRLKSNYYATALILNRPPLRRFKPIERLKLPDFAQPFNLPIAIFARYLPIICISYTS